MKSTMLALAALSGAAAMRPSWDKLDGYDFEAYQRDFGKEYSDEETPLRRQVFEASMVRIQEHNAAGHAWKRGVNIFTDMTHDERKAATAGLDKKVFYAEQAERLSGSSSGSGKGNSKTTTTTTWGVEELMAAFPDAPQLGSQRDWRTDGVITPVSMR